MAKKTDAFANKFFAECTESAANTLTFQELGTAVDVFSKRAWVLHRLEYQIPAPLMSYFAASDDKIAIALTSSNKMSSLLLADPAVIDLLDIKPEFATAVGFQIRVEPFIRDFSSLPGGGLIIAPRPLYLAIKGTSLAGATQVRCRGYYTQMDLAADEYLELVDFYRILA